jgi:hypothetical protein
MRRRVPGLLASAVRRRDARLFASAMDLCALPLAEIVGLLVIGLVGLGLGWNAMSVVVRTVLAALLGLSATALCAYVLIGMRVAGAGPEAYRALLRVRRRRMGADRTHGDGFAGRGDGATRRKRRMNLIVPILYGAVLLGLLAPRVTKGTIRLAVVWSACVMLWYYVRH